MPGNFLFYYLAKSSICQVWRSVPFVSLLLDEINFIKYVGRFRLSVCFFVCLFVTWQKLRFSKYVDRVRLSVCLFFCSFVCLSGVVTQKLLDWIQEFVFTFLNMGR